MLRRTRWTSIGDLWSVERLSTAEGPAEGEVSAVVAELNAAAQQLAKTLGGAPASTANDDDPLAAVRATLAQVRELVEAGYRDDVAVAAELDSSDAVPLLRGERFVAAAG